MAHVAPASPAAINPSGNGKKASLATALPLSESPASLDFQTAMRDASMRDICPAPIPSARSDLAYTIAFDFTCLTTRQLNNIALAPFWLASSWSRPSVLSPHRHLRLE